MIWFGLFLALVSAVLVNLGFYVEHRASSVASTLTLRHPWRGFVQLLRDPLWLAGYAAGLLGWGAYVAALCFAPLALVQGAAAAGIGVIALLVRGAGKRALSGSERFAVAVSLVSLLLIALTATARQGGDHRQGAGTVLLALAVIFAIGAVIVLVGARVSNWGSALGAFAGICYAAGDVATKAAVNGDGWAFIPLLLVINIVGFAVLQLSFQRGGALATAGVSTVLTNSLPIAAALAVFGEQLPAGPLGVLRAVALAAAIASAGVLAAASQAHPPGVEAQAPRVPAGATGSGLTPAGSAGSAAGTAGAASASSAGGGRRPARSGDERLERTDH